MSSLDAVEERIQLLERALLSESGAVGSVCERAARVEQQLNTIEQTAFGSQVSSKCQWTPPCPRRCCLVGLSRGCGADLAVKDLLRDEERAKGGLTTADRLELIEATEHDLRASLALLREIQDLAPLLDASTLAGARLLRLPPVPLAELRCHSRRL
jgi:hypothetical protein